MYRKGEAIPKKLYYPNYKLVKDRRTSQTPLMFWIEYRKGEAIPK